MKYLKLFEDININDEERDYNIYYKIFIDGSFDKFVIALEKLGIKDEFFHQWSIENFDDIMPENQEYFINKEYIYLFIEFNENTGEDGYFIDNNLDRMRKWEEIEEDKIERVYGGEVYIEDYEVDAKKYNI